MTVKIAPSVRQQFLDANGNPYVGYKLFTYSAGSSTKQATYTSSTGLAANTNPIILDAAGRTPFGLWLTAGLNYKFVLALATDTDPPTSPVFTEDVIAGVNDTASTTSQWQTAGVTPTYISATQFSLAGDKTADFHIGRRLKFTVTSGTVFGLITASAYTTLTTVTVALDSGVLDSGLSSVELSILTATGSALPVTAYIRGLIDDVDAPTARTTLGLGNAALATTGTTAGTVPLVGTKSATELLAGLAELATQVEAEAGTDDTVVMTPLKTKQAIVKLGKVLQVVHFDTGTVATGTTIIPLDDTIPQNTEGNQFMSLSITPISAASTLLVEVVYFAAGTVAAWMTGAVFRDSAVNSVGAMTMYRPTATAGVPTAFSVKAASGSTAATTFNVRIGADVADTITFNGVGGVRYFGGSMASSIRITEIGA